MGGRPACDRFKQSRLTDTVSPNDRKALTLFDHKGEVLDDNGFTPASVELMNFKHTEMSR